MASRRYRRCVLCCGSQMGKTDTLLDIIGQRLDERPTPLLYVGPSKQFLTEQFEPRVMGLLDESPTLAGKVARGKRMTKTRKVIAGVPLRLAHAGSSTALKSDPAGLAITDEADELMANIKNQGDPVGLIDARGDTYADFAHAITSTPSRGVKETEIDPVSGLEFWKTQDPDDIDSSIWKFWQAGTRYHWTWRCPHCGDRFVPRFSCLVIPKVDVTPEGSEKRIERMATPYEAREMAFMLCPRPDCGGVIEERHKAEMNATGVYVAPGQSIGPNGEVIGYPPAADTASFWVSGLCSPFKTFGDRAAAYVEAVQSGDQEKVQTVINAGFGELWAPTNGEAPEWAEVARLKLPYRFRETPEGVIFLTAGVDVQGNRLVYVVRGWGVRQESWLIEHGELFGSGDTRLDDVWIDLHDQVLDAEYGDGLRIARAFIDSGFRPDKPNEGFVHRVYDFCRRHARLCFATKGFERRPTPISVKRIDVAPSGGRPKFGLDLVRLDSDYMKSWVHSRIRWPEDQAGGWHLPLDADENYCRQIVNEARVRKPSGGYTWVPRGPRDYLDAEAMAYGAAKMIGLERLSDNAVRHRSAPPPRKPAPETDEREVEPTARTAPPPRPASSWLGADRTNNWLRR